jgi:hypothetical protein
MSYFTPIATLYFSRRWTDRASGGSTTTAPAEEKTEE